MLDLSKELGGVVSADGYGLGAIIDDVFKQVSESICNVQNNPARQHDGFGGSVAKVPQQTASNMAPSYQMPSINGAQPSSNPLATPSIIQQPASSSSSTRSEEHTSDLQSLIRISYAALRELHVLPHSLPTRRSYYLGASIDYVFNQVSESI